MLEGSAKAERRPDAEPEENFGSRNIEGFGGFTAGFSVLSDGNDEAIHALVRPPQASQELCRYLEFYSRHRDARELA